MHDINFIRDNPIIFDNFMKQRGELPCSKNIIKIDEDKRNTQTVLQNLLAERNKLSKEIGILKSQNKDSEVENILKRVFETYADYKKGAFPSGEISETIYFETYFKYMVNSNIHISGGIQRVKLRQDYNIDLGFSIQLLHYFLTNIEYCH